MPGTPAPQGHLGHPNSPPPACSLGQVREADCRAFTRRAAQGDTELLANLPDQRAALQHSALACLVGPGAGQEGGRDVGRALADLPFPQGVSRPPRLSASDLLLLGALVCDMEASSIVASDPHMLQNLQCCPWLTPAQQAALNTLLTNGRTVLGWVGPIPSARPPSRR